MFVNKIPEPFQSILIGLSIGLIVIFTFFSTNIILNLIGVLLSLGALYKLNKSH